MNTLQSSTQNRIIAPICIGIALLIGVVFLRPLYISFIEKKASYATLEKTQGELMKEYDALKSINNNTGSDLSMLERNRIKKIAKKYNTSDIMSVVMLNDFTKDTAISTAPIMISSININKGQKLPSGLSLGTVNISLQGKTIADIINYITSLTQDAPYIFTLDNISLPIDTSPEETVSQNYGLALELGVYYYDN